MHLYFCKSLHFKDLPSEIQKESGFLSGKSKKPEDAIRTLFIFIINFEYLQQKDPSKKY